MTWKKLTSRDSVDLATVAEIDVVFFDMLHKYAGTRKNILFTYFTEKMFTHYVDVDIQAWGRSVYEEYFYSIDQIKNYYEEGLALLKRMKALTDKWKKRLNKESHITLFLEALADFRKNLPTIYMTYSVGSWLAIEAWQNDFEDMLSAMIKRNRLEKRREQIMASAYRPWKNTAVKEIQNKLKKGIKIEKLVGDYQYLRSWANIWYRPLDAAWFMNLKISDVEKHDIYSYEELLEFLKPNRQEKHFLEMAPYIIFFKDWRDDTRRKYAFLWSFLFSRIAERYEITHHDLGFFTYQEIEEILKKDNLNRKVLEQRKKHACILNYDEGRTEVIIIDREIPEKYYDIINEVENKDKTFIIKGLPAQKGKVKGPVKIVRSYHDIKKVEEGDILVANTTHPTYLPAMHKAAAFVTNEGGMLSHAAIISREMKKPCIVNTKNATKILKTNDLVEVNADKGIVKILKKA